MNLKKAIYILLSCYSTTHSCFFTTATSLLGILQVNNDNSNEKPPTTHQESANLDQSIPTEPSQGSSAQTLLHEAHDQELTKEIDPDYQIICEKIEFSPYGYMIHFGNDENHNKDILAKLENKKINTKKRDDNGYLPVHYYATFMYSYDLLKAHQVRKKILLKKTAHEGFTPLHLAVSFLTAHEKDAIVCPTHPHFIAKNQKKLKLRQLKKTIKIICKIAPESIKTEDFHGETPLKIAKRVEPAEHSRRRLATELELNTYSFAQETLEYFLQNSESKQEIENKEKKM